MKYFFIFFLSTLILFSCSPKENKENSIVVEIIDFDKLEPRLHLENDTTYIVNFWATWCKPCVTELPDFEKVAAEYKNEKVKLLLVSMDFPQQKDSKVIPFIKEHNLKSEVVLLFDTNANVWINKVSPEWSGSIPATVIFNKKFRKFHEGSYSYEELKSIIESQKL